MESTTAKRITLMDQNGAFVGSAELVGWSGGNLNYKLIAPPWPTPKVPSAAIHTIPTMFPVAPPDPPPGEVIHLFTFGGDFLCAVRRDKPAKSWDNNVVRFTSYEKDGAVTPRFFIQRGVLSRYEEIEIVGVSRPLTHSAPGCQAEYTSAIPREQTCSQPSHFIPEQPKAAEPKRPVQNLCAHCLETGEWEDDDKCPKCAANGHTSPWRVNGCEACNAEHKANKMQEIAGARHALPAASNFDVAAAFRLISSRLDDIEARLPRKDCRGNYESAG